MELKQYWFDGYENESPEYSGRIFLHTNCRYEMFFDDLKKNIDQYMDHLNVDYKKLSYFVSKAWVGYHNKEVPGLNPHSHNEANISFVYYLKSSDKSDKFCVTQTTSVNQNTGALFETGQRNLISGFNRYNCNNYTITPKEGTVLLFPSTVIHSTMKTSEEEDERVVIAGDVRVTLKPEYQNYHQACTHPTRWLEL